VDFATLPIRDIMARGMAEASAMVEAMAGDEVCEEDSALATARVAATARGYGRRDFYPAWGPAYAPAYGRYAMNPQDEAGMLREEAEYIKQELDAFQKRLEELEAKSQQA
jgi:hypothetical protein